MASLSACVAAATRRYYVSTYRGVQLPSLCQALFLRSPHPNNIGAVNQTAPNSSLVMQSQPFSADATPSATPSSDDESSSSAGPESFLRKWRQHAPSMLSEPGFSMVDTEASTTASTTPTEIPDALSFSLFLPHKIMFQKKEVEMVLVPGTSGDFGIKPGHVPTIAQLRPGVMTVIHTDSASDSKEKEPKEVKYFIPAGFVVVHPNSSAELSALEAVPLEDLDAETVKQGLADYTAKLASGSDEYENAVAQVGIEVYQAMNSALEQK